MVYINHIMAMNNVYLQMSANLLSFYPVNTHPNLLSRSLEVDGKPPFFDMTLLEVTYSNDKSTYTDKSTCHSHFCNTRALKNAFHLKCSVDATFTVAVYQLRLFN